MESPINDRHRFPEIFQGIGIPSNHSICIFDPKIMNQRRMFVAKNETPVVYIYRTLIDPYIFLVEYFGQKSVILEPFFV